MNGGDTPHANIDSLLEQVDAYNWLENKSDYPEEYLSPEEMQKSILEGEEFVREWFQHPVTQKKLLYGGERVPESLVPLTEQWSDIDVKVNYPSLIKEENLLKRAFNFFTGAKPEWRPPERIFPKGYEEPLAIYEDVELEKLLGGHELESPVMRQRPEREAGAPPKITFKVPTRKQLESGYIDPMTGLAVHEFGHHAQKLFGGMKKREKFLMDYFRRQKFQSGFSGGVPYPGAIDLIPTEAYEDHSQLMVVRKAMYDLGLITGPGDTITLDKFNKLKESYPVKTIRGTTRSTQPGFLKYLKERYTDENVVMLLNTIAAIPEDEDNGLQFA